MKPRISVVIATYNRPDSLHRLLLQLSAQTMAPAEFEVVVVDDGSRTPLPRVTVPYRCTVLRQQNQGAAVAQHRGVGAAIGDVLLFIDDDMEVPAVLLDEHARFHANNERAVVLGCVRSPPGSRMPVFERFHAQYFDDLARDVRSGKRRLSGIDVWAGNLSMQRAQYIKVGGFDAALRLSQDAELGLRLEKDGAMFYLSDTAYSVQHSDHVSLGAWMNRACNYGRVDLRISRKHPEMRHASPWRYTDTVTLLSGPFLAMALAAPPLAHFVARAAMGVATALARMGTERAALAVTALAFGMEYTRGLRHEAGGLRAAVRDAVRFYRDKPS